MWAALRAACHRLEVEIGGMAVSRDDGAVPPIGASIPLYRALGPYSRHQALRRTLKVCRRAGEGGWEPSLSGAWRPLGLSLPYDRRQPGDSRSVCDVYLDKLFPEPSGPASCPASCPCPLGLLPSTTLALVSNLMTAAKAIPMSVGSCQPRQLSGPWPLVPASRPPGSKT